MGRYKYSECLEPLENLIFSLEKKHIEKKKKMELLSLVMSYLGTCNYRLALAEEDKDKKTSYFVKAREYIEKAHYMLKFSGYSVMKDLYDIELNLGPVEKEEIMQEKSLEGDGIFLYYAKNGYMDILRLEKRLKAIPRGDINQIAILHLKIADRIRDMDISCATERKGLNALFSGEMAYLQCKKILFLQDEGEDIWPGIIHKTIRFILNFYPDLKYEEALKLLNRGLDNSAHMGEEYRKEIFDAFAFMARRMKEFYYDERLWLH